MINFALLDDAFPNEDKTLKKQKKPISKPSHSNDCKPLQAPIYEIPNTCDEKNNFNKTLNIALGDGKFKDDFKKDAIKGYDFDEMDAYLNINNINTNNKDTTSEYRTTPFLASYLNELKTQMPSKSYSQGTDRTINIEQFTNGSNLKVDVNLYNLFLFIFLGIIIILLVDQITKLAIHT